MTPWIFRAAFDLPAAAPPLRIRCCAAKMPTASHVLEGKARGRHSAI